MSKIYVKDIGTFARGSFGTTGNPSTACTMYAVVCPRNSGNFPASGFVFTSRAQAEHFAREEEAYERGLAQGRRDAAAKAKDLESRKEQLRRGWDGYQMRPQAECDAILATL
jgi:hypothetical protein